MKKNLATTLREGKIVTMAWSSLGSPIVAENLIRCGYESVNIDMQHGLYSFDEARDAISAVNLAGGYAIARVPVGDFATVSRLLDCGAQAIIAPMINNIEDAKRFVEFAKFPPKGARSYGPHRALALYGLEGGQEYVDNANDQTITLAMIETKEALNASEAIASLDGIDGLFIGPADISISLSDGAGFGPTSEHAMKAAEQIANSAKNSGKIASSFAISPAHAREFEKLGYTLISNGTDMSIMQAGSDAMLLNA